MNKKIPMKKKLFLAGLALLLGVGGASCQFLTNAIQVITNPPSPFGTNPPVRISIITQHTNLDGFVLLVSGTNDTEANGLYVSNDVPASVTNINPYLTSFVYSGHGNGFTNWYLLDSDSNWFIAKGIGTTYTNWGIYHVVLPIGSIITMATNLAAWPTDFNFPPETNAWQPLSTLVVGSLTHQSYLIYTTTNTP